MKRFERALALNPDFPEALQALAKARMDAKQYPEAIVLLQKVVRLQPANESAHYSLMLAYRNAGRTEDAAREQAELDKLQKSPQGRIYRFSEAAGRKGAEAVIRWLAIAALFCAGAAAVDFRNVAREAGLTDSIPNGGAQSKKYIIETTGSGAAFLDYDNDGLLDIFLVSGPGGSNRLYHNLGNGKFADVTKEMGLEHTGWGQGVCAGDFDNDGYTDLFVTYWGANVLYRNRAGRGFEDVTAKAGLKQDRVRYNTGCAFLDYNNDGHLDLFVANYLKFDFAKRAEAWRELLLLVSRPAGGLRSARDCRSIAIFCIATSGDGTFEDVSEKSGIAKPSQNYSLSVLTGDFNHDGLTDIYVACDRTPSILYINHGDGTFSDEALPRGAAFDDNGKALSGMGVAAADYDGDGWTDIFRSNFSDERETLYRNRGNAEFDDVTLAAGMALNTRFVGWGCGFLDFDNDGRKGLLLVNGHAFPGSGPARDRRAFQRSGDFVSQFGDGEVRRYFGIVGAGHSGEAFVARRCVRRLR